MSTVVAKNLAVQNSTGTASVDLTTTDGSTLLADGVGVMKMMQLTPKTTNGAAFYDFTGIPAWAKKLTLVWKDGSTNGTSAILVQIGSGSLQTTGYNSAGSATANGASPAVASSSAGFLMYDDNVLDARTYTMRIASVGGNAYTSDHNSGGLTNRAIAGFGGGSVTLTGTLDRIRLTTVNGTDLFDAGSVSVLVEGY